MRALLLDPTTKTPVLLLKDRHSTKAMPIWIGEQEAMSIAIELQGHTFPRPLSHDLMKELLNTLGGNLERAVITSVKDDTYYASLVVRDAAGATRDIDARPSDAVALALRTQAPIFIEEAVFEKSAIESPFVEEEQFEEFVEKDLKLDEIRRLAAKDS
ncbi:MAG TPA: bifunctional nuclease family protein [Candidatus Bipolaricaulis sp.]|nr:bifunctional nuclease family protein [Candidatus Bipolaricaulis sp.]HPD06524.1 bifunctional nuclease family protein [Candidatus Bipolaricaulis sp.]HRS14007.1 bifunctional nuclease family protein [Candidatus Bipolaricaulis sp.]HRU21920.1 bifunctional nuclease family protein [Candidatus Bipolaricaulis sp.]